MEQKKKHNRNIYIVLAVVLCLAGVFFVKDAVRAVEEMAYPRTYAALVQQYAAEYGVDENKVYAIIRTESGFKPEAETKVGADADYRRDVPVDQIQDCARRGDYFRRSVRPGGEHPLRHISACDLPCTL